MINNFIGHLSALSNFRYVAKKKMAVNDAKTASFKQQRIFLKQLRTMDYNKQMRTIL